jgi:hypothetical protein
MRWLTPVRAGLVGAGAHEVGVAAPLADVGLGVGVGDAGEHAGEDQLGVGVALDGALVAGRGGDLAVVDRGGAVATGPLGEGDVELGEDRLAGRSSAGSPPRMS